MKSDVPTPKTPSRSNPYREAYDELQRVMASNRFIFTNIPIWFAIGLLLGPIPLLVYLGAGSVLIIAGLAFERPYQLLRKLLPYGNWPPHLVKLPTRVKTFTIFAVIMLTVMYSALVYVCFRYMFPFTGDHCMASLACLLLSHIF